MKNIKHNRILFTLFLSVFSILMFAADMSTADRKFEKFDYKGAIESYKAVLKKEPGNLQAKEKIAKAYIALNDYAGGLEWFKQLSETPGADVKFKYYYGQALRVLGNYDDAKTAYKAYSSSNPADPRATEILKGLDMIKALTEPNPIYEVKLLSINTKGQDWGPYVIDNKLYFTSNRQNDLVVGRTDNWTDATFLQLHTADISGDDASNAKLVPGRPNGRFHEGPITMDHSTGELYLTRNNYMASPQKSADDAVMLKLYKVAYDKSTQKVDKDLADEFPFNGSEHSCAHASLSKDGKELYFTSDNRDNRFKGHKGGNDIYVCKRVGNSWGEPQNLTEINTAGNEAFPFIADDGTLYFASDGHFGLGGLDIYSVKKDASGKWGKYANMGAPINSSYDDFAVFYNAETKKGYFSSNRPGVGSDDIYSFENKCVVLKGYVFEKESKKRIPNASLKLTAGGKVVNMQQANANGEYSFCVAPNTKYSLECTATGYDKVFGDIPVKEKEVNAPIAMVKTVVPVPPTPGPGPTPPSPGTCRVQVVRTDNGRPIPGALVKVAGSDYTSDQNGYVSLECPAGPSTVFASATGFLSNSGNATVPQLKGTVIIQLLPKGISVLPILYDLNKDAIRPDAAAILDQLVNTLNQNPTVEIELSSHTDCRSSRAYNQDLSNRRARSAYNYVISRGINPARLTYAGYGEDRLTNECACEGSVKPPLSCDEPKHQLNRRTEVKITKE